MSDFMNSINSILTNSTIDLVQKFSQMKVAHSQLYVSRLDTVISKIQERYNYANHIKSVVECGSTGNLVAYINHLSSLLSLVTDFKNNYNTAMQTYNNITRDFKPDIYTKIVDNSKVSEGVRRFM